MRWWLRTVELLRSPSPPFNLYINIILVRNITRENQHSD
jgi:hypothetical protein